MEHSWQSKVCTVSQPFKATCDTILHLINTTGFCFWPVAQHKCCEWEVKKKKILYRIFRDYNLKSYSSINLTCTENSLKLLNYIQSCMSAPPQGVLCFPEIGILRVVTIFSAFCKTAFWMVSLPVSIEVLECPSVAPRGLQYEVQGSACDLTQSYWLKDKWTGFIIVHRWKDVSADYLPVRHLLFQSCAHCWSLMVLTGMMKRLVLTLSENLPWFCSFLISVFLLIF